MRPRGRRASKKAMNSHRRPHQQRIRPLGAGLRLLSIPADNLTALLALRSIITTFGASYSRGPPTASTWLNERQLFPIAFAASTLRLAKSRHGLTGENIIATGRK